MEEEKGIICVIPVDIINQPKGMPEYKPSPGMVPIPCEKCGINSWIGPKQLSVKEQDPSVPIWCVVCFINQTKEWEKQGEQVSARVKHLSDD